MKPEESPGESASRNRLQAIQSSMRGFTYSLLGLIPLVGIPFSVAAIWQSNHAKHLAGDGWNPAEHYLGAARRIAPLGFLSSFVSVVVACFVLPAMWQGFTGGSPRGG